MPITIDDKDKIGKEMILLGDKSVTITDCDGNPITMTGLTGNDIYIKIGGVVKNLEVAITEASGGIADMSSSTVTLPDGSVTQLKNLGGLLKSMDKQTKIKRFN